MKHWRNSVALLVGRLLKFAMKRVHPYTVNLLSHRWESPAT